MEKPEIAFTVGMPVSNAMPWLPEAIESLLGQTYTSFEILAIVDGGSDASAAYLKSIANQHLREPRLRVLEQPNAGVTATLNRLLDEARTPWLVRMDADDISYPTRIEKLADAVRVHPGAGMIYSLADYHPRERCAGQFRCSRGTPEELRAIVESGYLLSICHSTVALNIAEARAAGGYRMNIHAEDADLWWRMARRSEVRFIPEPLVGFRLNTGSVSARNLEQQELAGMYVQYLLLSELWGFRPLPLDQITRPLHAFVRPATVTAKESLRRFNMHLARGQPLEGLAALAAAAWASPAYVARRVVDEFSHRAVANGVPPHLFLERKDVLWN